MDPPGVMFHGIHDVGICVVGWRAYMIMDVIEGVRGSEPFRGSEEDPVKYVRHFGQCQGSGYNRSDLIRAGAHHGGHEHDKTPNPERPA